MKKLIFVVFAAIILASGVSYAFDSALLDMYDELQQESNKIRVLLKGSKDIVLVSSMWDSTIVTMTQLEAYFSMLGIFNIIDVKQMDEKAIDYLIRWLNKIKATNELNIKSLNTVKTTLERNTELHTAVLKVFYRKLSDKIDAEIEKLMLISESMEIPDQG
ncbi:MAG: hypothetical protein JW800_08070 [Candidatus Omnitrophica bacterium]|nr:hypothetical protein [Candidatus Omnitrophota bacterium]